MAVESQRIISHSNFLFFVLSLSPNQMRDRLPLSDYEEECPQKKRVQDPFCFAADHVGRKMKRRRKHKGYNRPNDGKLTDRMVDKS